MAFATHALSPAKVSRITVIDPVEKHMEVIVDDSQLSLAIGKKGQNVRLAAKLLGWKIDIKSEEEKRQEVESAMAALVAPGAPVSVLLDYGLEEAVVQRLVEAGVGTIEKLGGMTPEELEGIEGIGDALVERIQQTVNAYYAQFEEPAADPAAPPAEPVSLDSAADLAETTELAAIPENEGAVMEAEPGVEEPESIPAVRIADAEPREDPSDSGEQAETKEVGQSDRIEDAGSPTHDQPEGSGPEDTPKEGRSE